MQGCLQGWREGVRATLTILDPVPPATIPSGSLGLGHSAGPGTQCLRRSPGGNPGRARADVSRPSAGLWGQKAEVSNRVSTVCYKLWPRLETFQCSRESRAEVNPAALSPWWCSEIRQFSQVAHTDLEFKSLPPQPPEQVGRQACVSRTSSQLCFTRVY